jgi:putative DNA primase/helicase
MWPVYGSIERPPDRVKPGPIALRPQIGNGPPEPPDDPDESEVAGWLAVLIDPGQVVELRAPKVGKPGSKRTTTVVRYFEASQLPEMAREALRLSGQAPAVYFTLNPVRAELVDGRKSATDADITGRRRLLIDCDPKRDPEALDAARREAKERGRDLDGLSATNVEKAASLAAAVAVRDHLTDRGWPEPVFADSGNGYHLIYAVDLPNDAVCRDLVKAMLENLATRFNSPEVEVDAKVFNASRVVKLYGTAARKGDATAERPHRISRVLKVPRIFTPVPRELIEAIASEATKPAESPATPPRVRDTGSHAIPGNGTTIPLSERLERGRKLLDVCEPAVSGEGGHDRLFKVACNLGPGLDLPPEDAFALLRDVYNPRCVPPWSEAELRHKVDDAYRLESRRGWLLDAARTRSNGRTRIGSDDASAVPPMDGGDIAGSAPPANGRGDHRRVDDADLPVNEAPDDPHRLARAVLADFAHRDGFTLAWHREAFHVWDGSAYRPDPALMNRVVALVKDEVDRQNRAALRLYNEQAEREVLAPALGRPAKPPVATRVTRRLIADVVQALASMTGIAGQDADPPFWIGPRPGDPDPAGIVPVSNGLVVLDAVGGPALRPHSPRLFSTHALPYPYERDAREPTAWLKFLDDLWGDDPASVRELQKWFGYALTPDIDQQKILLLVGSPGSGRSTIKDILSAVVGRRNVVSTSAVALADRFGLEPFMGKTLAILGDARTGDSHDTAVMMDRLLRISGGDPVEVNRKGKPILHDVLMRTRLVIVSNEMPNFRDASKAIVRRYLPLCTPRSFEGREDRSLPKRLLQELPGLLNWAIAGRDLLALDGRFIVPPSSEDLIDEAKALASPVAEFVAEECTVAPGQDATVDELWRRWKEWAERNGHQPSHRHLFGRNLRAATGFKIKVSQTRGDDARFRVYKGIGLKAALSGGSTY